MKSYKELEIYTLSYDLAIKIHNMSLNLPKYETYEEGSLFNEKEIQSFLDLYNQLGSKINKFIQYVEKEWK